MKTIQSMPLAMHYDTRGARSQPRAVLLFIPPPRANFRHDLASTHLRDALDANIAVTHQRQGWPDELRGPARRWLSFSSLLALPGNPPLLSVAEQERPPSSPTGCPGHHSVQSRLWHEKDISCRQHWFDAAVWHFEGKATEALCLLLWCEVAHRSALVRSIWAEKPARTLDTRLV